jgi:hypothetical protein
MAFPLPSLDVGAGLLPFVTIAIPMVAVTVAVLGLVRPTDGRSPLITQLFLAVAVVGGGSVLLLALLFVFIDTNGTTAWTWVLLGFNFMMTVPVGLWFVGHIVFEDRRIPAGGWLWPIAVGVAVTGSEVLMGLLFAVGGANAPLGLAQAFALGLSSVWFFWSMAGVMAPLVLWAPLSRVARPGGWALVAAAFVGPWVRSYPLEGGIAMGLLMAGLSVAVLRPLWRGAVAGSDGPLLLGLAAAFLAMTVSGLGVAATGGAVGAVLAFGATMALVMIGEVSYLLRRTYAPVTPPLADRAGQGAPAPSESPTARPGPLAGP